MQVYMAGCHFGVAVFEDIDTRDFNPNVSLELGYMLGTERRCLLLKERRLPTLPADVVNRLYKPFDAFDIDRQKPQGIHARRRLHGDCEARPRISACRH